MDKKLEEKITDLKSIIKQHLPVIISYSGGVDSALLAVIASREVGSNNAICFLKTGPEFPQSEETTAKEIAKYYNLQLETIRQDPFLPEIMEKNPRDRCRHCKQEMYKELLRVAETFHAKAIFDGANTSDLFEFRPGIDEMSKLGVLHPFIQAGISKQEIRIIAKRFDLPFWNKPSSACLISRIPYGEPITVKKLLMIDTSERLLKDLGFTQVRVRYHGNLARIEVMQTEIAKILYYREKILDGLKEAGFLYITVDLTGYRSGSMDEAIL